MESKPSNNEEKVENKANSLEEQLSSLSVDEIGEKLFHLLVDDETKQVIDCLTCCKKLEIDLDYILNKKLYGESGWSLIVVVAFKDNLEIANLLLNSNVCSFLVLLDFWLLILYSVCTRFCFWLPIL